MDVDEFQKRLQRLVGGGLVSLALSLGKDVGLIDALCMVTTGPQTVKEIADKARLKPRYVREWLCCMVAAEIVMVHVPDNGSDVSGDEERYYIPEVNMSSVTTAAKLSSAVPILAKRQEKVKQCMGADGPNGFSYSQYPELFDWLSDVQHQTVPMICERDVLPQVDELLPHLKEGCWVIDIGCGTGELITTLAQKFPHSSFIGVENSSYAIEKANHLVRDKGVINVTLEEMNAQKLPETWNACFDWVLMYGVLHDLSNPQMALSEVRRVLKNNGLFSLIEVGVSCKPKENAGSMEAAGSYVYSLYSCLPSSLAEISDSKQNSGMGIQRMQKLLENNEFEVINFQRMILDSENVHFVCKKKNASLEIEDDISLYDCSDDDD
ncbi:hypothetical protein CHS0354_029219 [Potamilus streckersoni]|uniref:Methyltransferase domain-containing protein n=1 Tax=Potamilus streckersoni TaxID=2493646 RepID=A0AAE0SUB0_9BIVA|nr:hypothetical protein CHS0354_029219 [Potamilus streckersoni]